MTSELSVRAVHLGGMRVLAESGDHQVLTDYPLTAGDAVEGLTSMEGHGDYAAKLNAALCL